MSCEAYDRAGKVGLRTIKGKLGWPYPKDDKNRPIVPQEELDRLAALAELEKKGTEISAKLKAEALAAGGGTAAATDKTDETGSAPTAVEGAAAAP